MNEKGLVVNLLYLAESEYVKPSPGRQAASLYPFRFWSQYVLDNYATVAEAVSDLEEGTFLRCSGDDTGRPRGNSTYSLAISDSTGDSAIFEYVGGKLVIHHGRQYQVMTNSPCL